MINLSGPHIADYDDVVQYEYAIRKLHRETKLHDAYKWARVFASKHKQETTEEFTTYLHK